VRRERPGPVFTVVERDPEATVGRYCTEKAKTSVGEDRRVFLWFGRTLVLATGLGKAATGFPARALCGLAVLEGSHATVLASWVGAPPLLLIPWARCPFLLERSEVGDGDRGPPLWRAA